MIWKTTLAFLLDTGSLFFNKNNSVQSSTFSKALTILLIFFGCFFNISNVQSQVFIPDGNYSATEYAGAVVKTIDPNASGTCEVKQVYSIVKSDANGPYLLLGFYNGNAGKAIFRYYFDTNPFLDLVSETYKNTKYLFPGADVVLQIDTNDSSALVYNYDGSNLVLNNSSGLIAKTGDFNSNDGKFIEIKVPLTGSGSVVDLCDLAEGGLINLGSYLSFSGGSLNAAACDSENIDLDINVSGTISGGKSYCSGSSNSTTLNLTGNFGAVKTWQKNEEGSGWMDIANTANTTTYVASNVSVTTTYRAVIVNNTCPDNEVETGIATITILQTPGAPVAGTVTQPTCELATGTFQITDFNTNNTYSFTPSVVSISDLGLVTANAGTYNFTVTNAEGCTSEASADVVVNEQLETPAAPVAGSVTQPTCEVATGSFQIADFNTNNTYSFTPSVVSISDSGLVTANAGTYNFTVTNAAGCTSEASADVVVNEQLDTPGAPVAGSVTQPTCELATGSFQITDFNTNNTYSFTPSVVSISDSGLVTANAGTYNFTVTNAEGCTSEASADVVVNEQLETPAAPVAGSVTQPTCEVATGTFQIADFNTNNTYSFTPSVVSISDSGLVTANAGTYNFTVTNAEGCTSEASADVVVNEQLETPAAPVAGSVTQPTCELATGSFQIADFNTNNTYSFTPSVVSVSDSGLVTANAGTYNFTVTNAAGCTSEASADVVVNEQLETPAAPVAGSVTQPTCEVATGTFQIADFNTNNTYSFTPSVVSISDSGLVTANAGTYNFTVTNADGCTSEASENIVVNEQLDTPGAPVAETVTQPTCEIATGSFQITDFNTNNTYSFTPSVVSISDSGLVTANAGTYNFTVTNADGCTSEASENIVVNEQLETPAAPVAGTVTQPTCEVATGSFQIADFNTNNTYSFTPSVVSISDSGLVTANAGTYNFTVTNAAGCTSEASADVVVNEQLDTPGAPVAGTVTQPTCELATGSFQIADFNTNNTYSFTPSVVSISDSGLVTANAGTYNFTVTNPEGCTSDASADVVVNEQLDTPGAPVAGSVTQPTCELATGSFSITAVEGLQYSLNGGAYAATSTFGNLSAGNYTVTARNADGCTSAATSVTINAQPATPAAPVVVSTTQPSCEVTAGSFSITAVAGLQYSLNGGAYAATSTFGNLSAGTYTVTARNADGCISAATSVTISQTVAPATPVVASTTQPTCSGTLGSFSITAVEGLLYSLDGGAYAGVTTFEELSAGTYTVTARNADGCTSAAVTVSIEESSENNAQVTITRTTVCDDLTTLYDLNSLVDFSNNATAGIWVDTDQTGALRGSLLDPAVPAPGSYTFTYVIEGACPSSIDVTVIIEDCGNVGDCSLSDIRDSISKAVTPNGDGFNDFFTIDINNACLFTYNVKIFNRWGAEIFAANRYQNNWDGFSNRSVSSSNQLPSGTYYYIVEVLERDGTRSAIAPIQGYIYLGTK